MRPWLFCLHNKAYGGAERILQSLHLALLKNGHSSSILLFTLTNKRHGFIGVFTEVLLNFVAVLKFCFHIRKACRSNDGLIIVSSLYFMNIILGCLRRIRFIPKTAKLVLRESTLIFDRINSLKFANKISSNPFAMIQKLYGFAYSKADLIIFQTKPMQGRFLHYIPNAISWPSVVLQNPVDLQEWRTRGSQEILENCTFDRANFIVAAGRTIKEKGYDVLLQAFAMLNDHSLQLVILGDGPLTQDLQLQAKDLGLIGRVHFLGYVDNPMPYFKLAKCCVVSSRVEGFPNVLLQMMSLNDRVVSTLCAGGIDKLPCITTVEIENAPLLSKAISSTLQTAKSVTDTVSKEDFLDSHSVSKYADAILASMNHN
ncbi:MAG: hypothetical protein RL660_601 [Bacteroidota bacterium]|jgi:glycosyltransferase involved in cell wall biosynthesis